MHTPTRALASSLLLITAAGLIAGCEAVGVELKPGAKSILEAFAGPTPQDAATWAIDPFDADKRYRGTLLLANAPFAGEPVYLKLFSDNFRDTDPGVRAAAARGLGTHGSPEHAPLLIERLADDDAGVRIEAARALQRIHSTDAIDPLLARLRPDKEPEAQVRIEAASALGQYPQNRVVEQLIIALADENLAVNRTAQLSLRTLTGQDFGIDRAQWLAWYTSSTNAFAARSVYVYPVFSRKKKFYEHIPFIPGPPNEAPSTPAGMTPGTVE
jgi:hypothetical protein